MKTRSETFLFEDQLQWEKAGEGVRRQIMGYDGQIMLVKIDFDKGAEGYMHEHFHSQTSYIVSGKFQVTVDGEVKTLGAGDGFFAAPDLQHGLICLEAGRVIDVFTPHRMDFLKK